MTLDEAIRRVLTDAGEPIHITYLVAEIQRRDLYRRGDDAHPNRQQVSARIAKQPDIVRPGSGMIALVPPDAV